MSDMAIPESRGDSNFVFRCFGEDSGVRQFFGLGVWIGAWTEGRLNRVGYVLAALILYGLLGLVQWMLLDIMTPDPIQLTPTSQPMSDSMQFLWLAAITGISMVTLIIGLNIAAKRIRAIGGPGWGGAALLTVINAVSFFTIPEIASPWLSIVFMVALAVLPNGMLKRA